MLKILIVDDSPTARELIRQLLSGDPGISVIGTAANGEEALRAVQEQTPDAITMDINMPRMDGLEATRRIMETRPTPIIIVSAHIPAEETATFQAMEAGALAVIRRPAGVGHPEYESTARELIRTVKTMAEVKLVKRWPRVQQVAHRPGSVSAPTESRLRPIELAVIGGSTGAPGVLETILKNLPPEVPFPVVVVQHITAGFVEGFAEWLGRSTGRRVRVAQDRERLLTGVVYVAPDHFHTCITSAGLVSLTEDPPEFGMRPAICALFRSAAYSYAERAAGVLLTGMGVDGAEALKLMRDRGAVTIVQDPESAVISSMPSEAIQRGAAAQVLAPAQIGVFLGQIAGPPIQKPRN